MSVWLVAVALLVEVAAMAGALGAMALSHVPLLPPPFEVVATSILFGGLGGCTYCLRGVYWNACVRKNWDTAWLPWYLIRPAVSLILGGVSYLFIKSGLLLFGATQQQDAGQLGVWAVAFLAGLNVDKFLTKVESIGHTVWGLEPSRQSKVDVDKKEQGSAKT